MPNNNQLYTIDSLLREGIYDEHDDALKPVSKVLVPKIQRPYAQGRVSQKEIRENFLTDIFDHIAATGQPLELNFVYGALTDGTFELLDGQQRLSTLFLLAWYLAVREGNYHDIVPLLAKFTYETRTTSTGFIKKLIDKKLTVEKLIATGKPFEGISPKEAITRLGWYTGAYSNDSTVAGMLVMLDAIHKKYTSLPNELRPTYADLENLQFYLLDLNRLGLTDELFIKMNARGLQLTPFENFKAELSGWLRSNPFGDGRYDREISTDGNNMPLWLFISSSIDGRWNDIFWRRPSTEDVDDLGADEADSSFFRFIKRWLAVRAIAISRGRTSDDTRDDDWTAYFRYFSDKAKSDGYHSFDKFKAFVTAANAKGFDIIAELSHILTAFSDPQIGTWLTDAFSAPWADSSQKPWEENFERRPMIIFSAITEFILSHPYNTGTPQQIEVFDQKEFRRWMRMVHNIVENRNIDGERPQLTALRQLKDVLDYNKESVYKRLLAYIGSGDSNREFREEAAKINRILSDADWTKNSPWEEAFIDAEKDPYLTGSVAFYLDETTDVDTFRKRTSRIPWVFNAGGVKTPYNQGGLLWRAILARDTDWSSYALDTWNIRITNKVGADRQLKMRTVWNEAVGVRRLFCELLDNTSDNDMTDFLNEVAEETNPIVFPPDWSEEVQSLTTEGYNTLHSAGKNNGPMGWFDSITWINAINVKFFRNGIMALYHGNVNCMFLNSYRERFIPQLETVLTDANYLVVYCDKRVKDNFNLFGLYSGDHVELIVSANEETLPASQGTSEEPAKYLLQFNPRFGMYVYVNSDDNATRIAEMLAGHPELDTKEEPFENASIRKTVSADNGLFYLAAYAPDIRLLTPRIIMQE